MGTGPLQGPRSHPHRAEWSLLFRLAFFYSPAHTPEAADPLGGIPRIVHVSSREWADLQPDACNHLHELAAELPSEWRLLFWSENAADAFVGSSSTAACCAPATALTLATVEYCDATETVERWCNFCVSLHRRCVWSIGRAGGDLPSWELAWLQVAEARTQLTNERLTVWPSTGHANFA